MTAPHLWSQAATDDDGTWELSVATDDDDPTERLVIRVETESSSGHEETVGLSLTRASVQEIRHVITTWLIDTAPLVGEP